MQYHHLLFGCASVVDSIGGMVLLDRPDKYPRIQVSCASVSSKEIVGSYGLRHLLYPRPFEHSEPWRLRVSLSIQGTPENGDAWGWLIPVVMGVPTRWLVLGAHHRS